MTDSDISKLDTESKIAQRLDDTFSGKGIQSVEPTGGNNEEKELEAQIEREQSGLSEPASKTATAKEGTDEQTEEFVQDKQEADKVDLEAVKPPEDQLPTLPNAYKRAAIHQEWTEEEIDEFYNADPEKALKTFAKLHESNNKLSQKFSEFGNLQAQQEQQAETQRLADEEARASTHIQPKSTTPVDMSELKRVYGNDPIVDIVQSLSDKISDMTTQKPVEKPYVPPVHYQPPVQKQPVYDENAAFRTLDSFFASETAKDYTQFYGESPDWNKLTQGEFANRRAVVQLAGSIVAGASMKGENMSDEIALEKAHLIVSQPYLEKAIVADIHKQLQKRGNSMTIRTNATGSGPVDSSQKTGSQLTATEREDRAKVRLDKIFRS